MAEFFVVSSSLTPAVGPVEAYCQLKLGREELTAEIDTGCSSSILSQFVSPQHPLLSPSLFFLTVHFFILPGDLLHDPKEGKGGFHFLMSLLYCFTFSLLFFIACLRIPHFLFFIYLYLSLSLFFLPTPPSHFL